MCIPVALAVAGAVPALLNIVSAGVQAKAQSDASEYEQQVARQNQHLSELASADATQRGELAASQVRAQGTRAIGEQKAAYAGGGVDVTSGTALNAMADARMASELDARTAENNAAREAWGYQVQAAQYGQQAEVARRRGQYAVAGTLLGAVGQLAKGAAGAYGQASALGGG